MDEIWKIVRWFFFYLLASIFALATAIFSMDLFWPRYDINEQSSGPEEQQFYLLLVNRAYWINKFDHTSHFNKGLTGAGRQRFMTLLKDLRFTSDCLSRTEKKNGEEMSCTVNGEWIYFVNYGG